MTHAKFIPFMLKSEEHFGDKGTVQRAEVKKMRRYEVECCRLRSLSKLRKEPTDE